MKCVCPRRYWHDGGEDLRFDDDNGLLQTEQSQETQAAAGGSGQHSQFLYTLILGKCIFRLADMKTHSQEVE